MNSFTVYTNASSDVTQTPFESCSPLDTVVADVLTKRGMYFSGTITGLAMLQLGQTTQLATTKNTYFWRLRVPLLSPQADCDPPPDVVFDEAVCPPIVSHDVSTRADEHVREIGALNLPSTNTTYQVFALFSSVPYPLFRSVVCSEIDLKHPHGKGEGFPQYQAKCCMFAHDELATVKADGAINYFDGCAFTKRGAVGMSLRRACGNDHGCRKKSSVCDRDRPLATPKSGLRFSLC
jgi:hypothetical protein